MAIADEMKDVEIGQAVQEAAGLAEPTEADAEALEFDIEQFESQAIHDLESLRRECDMLREQESWTDRLELNEMRAKSVADPSRDADFSADLDQEDGYASMNVCQGWAARNIIAADSALYNILFEQRKDFFRIQGWGRKDENPILRVIQTAIAQYLLRKSKFHSDAASRLTLQVATYGMGVLMTDLAESHRLIRMPSGEFREVIHGDQGAELTGLLKHKDKSWRNLVPVFDVIYPDDVWVTDENLEDAKRQTAMFIAYRGMTVAELAKDEFIEREAIVDEEGQQVTVIQKFGKWINFDRLRKREMEMMGSEGPYSNTTEVDSGNHKTSTSPKFTVIAMKGSPPWWRWLGQGIFTVPMARRYGLDKIFPGVDFDDDSDENRREVARLFSSVAVWDIAYTQGHDPEVESSGVMDGILLQIEPSRFREPIINVDNYHWIRIANKFRGRSIAEQGEMLEKMGDMIRNNQLRVSNFNARRSGICNSDVLENPDDIKKVFDEMTLLKVRRQGVAVKDVVDFFELPVDVRAEETLASLETQYDKTTMIAGAVKGFGNAPATRTLGEIEQNRSQSTSLIKKIAVPMAYKLADMVKFMLCQTYHFLGREQYVEMAKEVAGLDAAQIEESVLDEIENEEFDVMPILSTDLDPIAQSTQILRAIQVGRDVLEPSGVRHALRRVLELAGETETEPYLPADDDLMTAEQEWEIMRMGTFVKVDPEDNHEEKIQKHSEKLKSLLDRNPQDEHYDIPFSEWSQLVDQLKRKIKGHTAAFEMQQFEQQQQQQQMAQEQVQRQAGAGAPQPNAGGGQTQSPLETNTQAAGNNELSNIVSAKGTGGV